MTTSRKLDDPAAMDAIFEAWYSKAFTPRARMRAETKDREPFGETFFKTDVRSAFMAGATLPRQDEAHQK